MLKKSIPLSAHSYPGNIGILIDEALLSRSMAARIAWRNSFSDKLRFAAVVIGIVFSTLLIGIEVGFLEGFIRTTSALIDHSKADLWITNFGARSFEAASPIDYPKRFEALGSSRVERAEPYFLQFSYWKRPDGVREVITLIGVDPEAKMGIPWEMEDGRDPGTALAVPGGVLVDRLYAEKLGVKAIGDVVEINGVRAKITGFTKAIRSFTQSPYVFTALKNAQDILKTPPSVISYILIRLKPGENARAAVREISRRLPNSDVMTTSEFATRSQNYWLHTTGAGASLIGSAVLGFVVGSIIVGQTLYTSTIERIAEYAALRAIGAPKMFLYQIVLVQAMIAGVLGYAIGMAGVLAISYVSKNGSASIVASPEITLIMFVIDIVMCGCSSLISVRRLTKVDPVSVFR